MAVAAATVVGVALASTAAHAAPTTFTFDPTAAGLAGTPFTGDTLNMKDYARVDLGATGALGTAFTETGFLQVNNVSLGNATPFLPAGLNSTYSLYFKFSGAGTQSAASFGTSSTGTFSSLTYQLYGVSGDALFGLDGSNNPAVTNTGSPVELATGTLISGGTTLTVLGSGISPGASITATLDELVPGFFSAPMTTLNLAGAFNNDVNIVTVLNGGKTFTLNGGGGDVTFSTVVPEPLTLAILSTGLLGLAVARRRA